MLIKYFYCQNCDENMVMSSNKGVPWKFCKDCMNAWVQERMLEDPSVKRLDTEHKPR